MRTEQRTKMVPTVCTVYIAEDGTEWQSAEACQQHELITNDFEIEGVKWYDQDGSELALNFASWDKVCAIRISDAGADYALFGFLEALECEMSCAEEEKFSTYRDIDVVEGNEIIVYNPDTEKWLYLMKEYQNLKSWIDKLT